MTAESIINPSTVVANGIAVTTASPLPVTLVGGVSPTTLAIGTPLTGGATNQVLYQDSSSNLAEITKANSSVLVSNGSGVPSWSTTLPAGLAATSMTLTTPALGVATGTSLALGGASLGGDAFATATGTISAATIGQVFATSGNAGTMLWRNAGQSAGVTFNFNTDGTLKLFGRDGSTPAALIMGTYQSAAPAGSSAGLWKLGALQTAAVVLDTTRSIFVDIGGVVYKLMVAQ